jgi:NADPH:quinone reductase
MSPMRFIGLSVFGSAEYLQVETMAVPLPAANEVLIKVHAAGINRPDILQRQGLYPAPLGASPVLGLEVAGEVVACGEAVTNWKLGDRVCALVNGGGYAEYALAPAAQCLPIPASFNYVQAAALPEVLFTLWHNLYQRVQLSAGESVLIHGGGSGIGTTAIQLAKAHGSKVFVTAGSREKCMACEALGAKAINYIEQDYVAEIKSLTQGQGVNVILDMVGGDYMQRNFSVAATAGRIVNIAFLQGSRCNIDFMPLMLKRLTLTGSTLRAQSSLVKATIAKELHEKVWPLLNAQKIQPVIDSVFSLGEVAAAHRRMESNQHIGKIILEVNHGES